MAIYKGTDFIGVNTVKEKKIYVDVPEGSTIEDMSENNTIAISSEQFVQLEDAIGYRVGDYSERSISQMINKLKEKYFCSIDMNYNIGQNSFTTWTRPNDWPDLDSLNLQMSGDDYIYMTYDTTSDLAAVGLHIETSNNNKPIVCTLGHIVNGEYVVDETITGTNNNYVYWFNNYQYTYPVVRVLGSIKYCYTYSVTNTNNQQLNYRKQPIIERIAYVPHLLKFCTSYSSNAWTTFSLEREKVGNGTGQVLNSLYYAWAYGRRLRSLDISELLIPNVTTMECCFRQCQSLIGTLDLRHWNMSKVTNFAYVFDQCRNIETIDLRNCNLSSITLIYYCFEYCWALKEIKGISEWNVSQCKDFRSIFLECWSLQELDLESWNTSQVTTMASLFSYCYSLKSLKISSWDISKVTTLGSTFNACWSLQELDISSWTPIKVTSLSTTFGNCRSLKRLDLTNWTTGTLTSISSMCSACYSLQQLSIPNIIITNACTSIYCAFNACWSLKELHLNSNWDVSGVTSSNNTANSMFANCYSIKEITGISNWQFYLNNALNSMFANCYSLTTLDVSNWKVDTITSFASMFDYCYSLRTLDVSRWNVQSATNLSSMFRSCYHLQSLNLSQWNTSACTTFANMFSNCYSLTTVGNLSNWDTSNVTTLGDMFYGCRSLIELNGLSSWDVSKVTTAVELFYNDKLLEELNIEGWNLASCTNINSIFRELTNLKTLSLKNWSIPKITAAPTYFCTGNWNLKNILYTLPIAYNHSYNSCEALTHESVLTILNTLPTVSSARTLNLTTMNINMLTTEEKAIATNKGWTLAN